MAESTYPSSIPVKELRKHSCEFDPVVIDRYQTLYEGGQRFRKNIADFLIKRQIEKSAGGRSAHFEYRKERAWYVNRCSGLIDWLVAEVCKRPPVIKAKKDPTGYWEGLNKDADGFGRNLSTLVRQVARDIFITSRGWFGVTFPTPEGKKSEQGTLDAKIKVLPAASVRDWQRDERGNLLVVRYDASTPERDVPYLQPTKERCRWTFSDVNQTASYQFVKEIGKEFPARAQATLDPQFSQLHDFGICPVFPAEVERELWVMNKIEDPVIALFNRESATTFALDATAYAMLTLNMDRGEGAENNLVASELAALILKPGETATFTSPQPAIFEPLFKDSERLKQALYEVLQTLAANALATQTQNARQAASAKEIDLQPMSTLLMSYAWPIRDALERMVDAIKKHRNEEDNEVEIEGLDEFDATMEDAADALDAKQEDKPTKE